MTIMQRIENMAKNKGMSLRSLATSLDLSADVFAQIKFQNRTPSLDIVTSVAKYFGTSLDYVVYGKEFNVNISEDVLQLAKELDTVPDKYKSVIITAARASITAFKSME